MITEGKVLELSVKKKNQGAIFSRVSNPVYPKTEHLRKPRLFGVYTGVVGSTLLGVCTADLLDSALTGQF